MRMQIIRIASTDLMIIGDTAQELILSPTLTAFNDCNTFQKQTRAMMPTLEDSYTISLSCESHDPIDINNTFLKAVIMIYFLLMSHFIFLKLLISHVTSR